MSKVFIGMPVYNGMPYLKDALACLLEQTYTDIKIFVSDNASTDGSSELIAEYAGKDQRIIHYRHSHTIPVYENFSFVAAQCDCEYFMFAAHDDLWDKAFIKELYDVLSVESGLSGVFCSFKIENYVTGEVFVTDCEELNLHKSVYDNLYAYINRPISNAFYGLFRSDVIKWLLEQKEFYDWLDVVFIYHAIIKGNFHYIHKILYTSGIVSKERHHITINNHSFLRQEYSKYFSQGIEEINSGNWSSLQKKILYLAHMRMVFENFLHIEANASWYLRKMIKYGLTNTNNIKNWLTVAQIPNNWGLHIMFKFCYSFNRQLMFVLLPNAPKNSLMLFGKVYFLYIATGKILLPIIKMIKYKKKDFNCESF